MTDDDAATTTICRKRGCGRLVRVVVTELGYRLWIDPEPHPDGNIVSVAVDGRPRVRVLSGTELPVEPPRLAWRPHRRTCGKRPKSTAPRCRVCDLPMHPGLTELEGTDTHPSCDPPGSLREMIPRKAPKQERLELPAEQ